MPEPRSAFDELWLRMHDGPANLGRVMSLGGVYLDPINRHRHAYLRDEITVAEMETRIGREIGLSD